MGTRVGNLFIKLGLNQAEFDKDLKKASRRVRRAGRKMRKSFQSLDKALLRTAKLTALVAGPAALGFLVKSSFDTIDALAKTADKLGIATDKLAGLQHAANITGVAQETLNKALTKQQKAIFDADKGLVTYSQHFDTLNLSTVDLMKLSPDEQFKTIGDALNKVENQTLKTAIAYDVFGGRGTALINTLALGTKGLEDMQKEAEALGLAVSGFDAKQIEETNDAFQRMKGVVKGAGNTIAVKLAPLLTDLSDRFTKAAVASDGFKDQIQTGMDIVIKSIGFVANAMRMLEIGWKTINVIFQGFIATATFGLEKLAGGVNELALALGMESAINPAFLEFAEATRAVLAKTTEELVTLTSMPLPSENIEQWKNEVIANAQEAGEAVAKSLAGGGEGDSISIAKKAELERALEALRESILTEEEILEEKRILDLENLAAAEQAKIETLLPFHELREKLEEKHQKKLGDIKKKQADKDSKLQIASTATTMQMIGAILSAAANLSDARNKKEFERNKKLQMAAVVINTASAIMRAYAENNFWMATGMAIVLGLLAAAQLSKISGSSYSGGGSAPSGSVPAPSSGGGGQQSSAPLSAPPPDQQQAATPTEIRVVVNIDGQPIIDTVQEATANGMITIDANSVRAV